MRKPSSQGEGSCTAYSEVSPLRQDAATLSQIRRKLRVRRKCHLQSGTNQPSAAAAAVTEAATAPAAWEVPSNRGRCGQSPGPEGPVDLRKVARSPREQGQCVVLCVGFSEWPGVYYL